MLREDDSRITFREMKRWLLPAFILIIGLFLFFSMTGKTESIATPIPVDLQNP